MTAVVPNWKMETACLAQARDLEIGLCCLCIGNVAGAGVLLINGRALQREAWLQLYRFEDGSTLCRTGGVRLDFGARRPSRSGAQSRGSNNYHTYHHGRID